MARGNRPNNRGFTTATAVNMVAKGIVGARRFTIPAAPTVGDLTIPERVNFAQVQNVGLFPVFINFNSDSSTNYWELLPRDSGVLQSMNSKTPVLHLTDQAIIHGASVGGVGLVQVLFWG